MKLDHVNIVVRDMEASVRFYEQFLGLRRGFERMLEGEWLERVTGLPCARAHCIFMETDEEGARLELLQYLSPDSPAGANREFNSAPNARGIRHLAFTVSGPEAMALLVVRLRAADVPVVSDPVEVPFQVGSLGRKQLLYFLDPDGTLVEAAAYG